MEHLRRQSRGFQLNQVDVIKSEVAKETSGLRVAIPCIITAFYPDVMRIDAQPATQIFIRGEIVSLPLLVSVPISIPTSGSHAVTIPVAPGDECLVVFCDYCIDGWLERGGTRPQPEVRHHHISDGVAIIGIHSKPRVIPNYRKDALELRSFDGKQRITLKSDGVIEVTTDATVEVLSCDVNLHDCSLNVENGDVVADGVSLKHHIHTGDDGGDTSQPHVTYP